MANIKFDRSRKCYYDADTGAILYQGTSGEWNKKVHLYRETPLWFGKYDGKTVDFLLQNDSNYLAWMISVGFIFDPSVVADIKRLNGAVQQPIVVDSNKPCNEILLDSQPAISHPAKYEEPAVNYTRLVRTNNPEEGRYYITIF